MRYIHLNKKNDDRRIIVDDEDYERTSKIHWSVGGKGSISISHNSSSGRTIQIGRFILNENRSEYQVDHINRNPFDNRKTNLRICTHHQNQMNRGLRSDNKSGFKGVAFEKGKWWSARIKYKEKRIFIGFFKEKIEAAKAYNEKAKEIFGEFAWLNPV
jgi:hypothetical protein